MIDIPKDVTAQEIEFNYPEMINLRGYKPNYEGHPKQISRAAAAINGAKKPVICAGGGVISSSASRELTELAEKNDIPVVNTLMGIGSISLEHPLALGMMGIHGTYCANKAVSESDIIIALGARFSDRSIGNPKLFATNAEIIHIDIDPAEIGKNVKADIPIVGELSDILNEILKDV